MKARDQDIVELEPVFRSTTDVRRRNYVHIETAIIGADEQSADFHRRRSACRIISAIMVRVAASQPARSRPRPTAASRTRANPVACAPPPRASTPPSL
jgi:hypothetical protein